VKQANQIIITKLEDFIAKFYRNKAIKGSIYTAILLILCFVALNIVEFFGYNSSLFRTIIFWGYIVMALAVIILWIAVPLMRIYARKSRLSYKEAAKIIGKFFPDIDDKLINLLELQQEIGKTSSDLLQASIEQRTASLSPIPFAKAIDKTKNKKYFRSLLLIVMALAVIFMVFPSLITEPSERYIKHNRFFVKPAPFSFEVKNKQLEVVQQQDFEIVVQIKGKALPNQVNIIIEGQSYVMKAINKTTFSYLVRQVQRDMDFYFDAADVRSRNYVLKARPKPVIVDIQTDIAYPPYTQMKPEQINAASQISVPKGSIIRWAITTRDTKKLIARTADKQMDLKVDKSGRVKYEVKAMKDFNLTLLSVNDEVNYADSVGFAVNVIEDLYPQIAVIEQRDSILPQEIFFRGQIKDDYGFTKLHFNISVFGSDKTKPLSSQTEAIIINTQSQAQEFYFREDLSRIKLEPGQTATYWFEVWDNDAVNGVKSTKSTSFNLSLPTLEQLKKDLEKESEKIKQQSDKTLDEIKKIKQEIDALQKRLLEKRSPDWQDTKQMQELLQKQQELKQRIENIRDQIKQNNDFEQRISPQDEQIMEKQQELEKLFEDLMNEDMKKTFEELQKLMDKQMNKEEIRQTLEKMKLSNEDISKELDKDLEMYKRLEIEKKTNEVIEKLNELSKRQEQLSLQRNQDSKQQEQLSKEFNDIRKDLDKIQKESSELSDPQSLPRDKQKEESIKQNQSSAEQNIKKGNQKQASGQQKQAAEDMKQMADKMEQGLQEQNEEQLAEDITEVRQILKNLVRLSQKQEDLIDKTKTTSVSDKMYQKIINDQNNIKEDMVMIADSLFAMSKRQKQVSGVINKNLSQINASLNKSIDDLLRYNQSMYKGYKNPAAANQQQYAMTAMNNLALLLAESLKNMQMQQKQQQSKSKQSNSKPQQSCPNPGSSNNPRSQSPKNMKQMQEALNKEIERLKRELDAKQSKPQGMKTKIGEDSKLNEELARAAAQQSMLRKMVQDMANEKKKSKGKAAGMLNDLLKQMEQTEKDIVNKNITQQTLTRQKNITTRLLEHEKANQKREQEERRQSQQGVDKPQQNNANFEQFKKLQKRDLELLKQIPPIFTPYYKTKVNNYFYNQTK
jgi:hypothetical protein